MPVIRGQVSGFTTRYEPVARGASVTVWDFRVDPQDAGGKPLPRVAFEMRGTTFDGAISVGDWVEADTNLRNGKTLRVSQIKNLTTNAIVQARGAGGGKKAMTGLFKFVFMCFWLAVLGVIIWVVLTRIL